MKIERVQYDGEGQWLDVVFDDGLRAHLPVGLVRALTELFHRITSTDETKEKEP